MTATAIDPTPYVDKKVVLVVNGTDDEDQPTAEEVTGTIVAANPDGILFKPKGKSTPDIIEVSTLESIELAPEADKKISAKYIADVELGKARGHLLERHGITLSDANSMTEEEAFASHAEIDHEAADLGHRHGEKPKRAKKEEPASDAPAPGETGE